MIIERPILCQGYKNQWTVKKLMSVNISGWIFQMT